ncbi:MAG: zinc ribbon domain-containing protein [Planctomycetes bacterium]|nr:zinc ribbon domain-containing protein [Planctomycetota bacterium]MBI3843523.1 zinc ribbon domain-containing protein [Planctomycetota bacterium]
MHAANAVQFPCPSCGAGLAYDPKHQGLRCPFCGNERTIDANKGAVPELDLDEALHRARDNHDATPRDVRRVSCQACGATVEIAPTEKAGKCTYCGSSRVVEDEPDPTRIRPTCLVPFAVDTDSAQDLFRKWIRSRWFRPNALTSRSTVVEMRGVLVPFWTYDAHASSTWTAEAGYHYYVTVGSGQNQHREQRTRWEPADGAREDDYDDVLVCASKGLDAKLLGKIEPFALKALVPYRDEYLSGWTAESYAVDVQEGWKIAKNEIVESQTSRCDGDVPGDTHRSLEVATRVDGQSYKHLLLPVWISAYRYGEKSYRFMINGQTGELHGQAPLSWVKIVLLILAIAAVAGAIALIAANR